jgi:hypothetical protein
MEDLNALEAELYEGEMEKVVVPNGPITEKEETTVRATKKAKKEQVVA